MAMQWGRKESIIWPPRSPIYTYGAIFFSVVAAGFFLYFRFSLALTPMQEFSLPYYVRTAVAGTMHQTDKYQLLAVTDSGKRTRLATEEDVVEGSTPEPGGHHVPLRLSTHARAAG